MSSCWLPWWSSRSSDVRRHARSRHERRHPRVPRGGGSAAAAATPAAPSTAGRGGPEHPRPSRRPRSSSRSPIRFPETPKFVAPVMDDSERYEPEQTADIGQVRGVAGGVPAASRVASKAASRAVSRAASSVASRAAPWRHRGRRHRRRPRRRARATQGPGARGRDIQAPRKLKHVDPEYSELARPARVSRSRSSWNAPSAPRARDQREGPARRPAPPGLRGAGR